MRGHTYHDHILDALPETRREEVTDLIGRVQSNYGIRYRALMIHGNPYTWQDALKQIFDDSLEFLQDCEQLQRHGVDMFSEVGTPLHGVTLRSLQTRARSVTSWCKDVQRGLLKAQVDLFPHFNEAWATKALLYLRDLYEEQVDETTPHHGRMELRANKAYEMMVSLHHRHGFTRKNWLTRRGTSGKTSAPCCGCHGQEAD